MSTGFDGPIEALQEQSRQLALSDTARKQWFLDLVEKKDVVQQATRIWTWSIEARQASRGIDEGGKIFEASILEARDEQMQRSILCARILRNAVVGLSECQESCYEGVSSIIQILWITTSFAYESDAEIQTLTRTLVQLLSNMITMNEELQNKLWFQILCKDEKEVDKGSRTGADLFGRLLQSSDASTRTAAQVLLLNCTLDSTERSKSLSLSRSGVNLLSSMLNVVQQHLDTDEMKEIKASPAEDQLESIQIQISYENLGILYTFFTNLFDQQLFGPMLVSLAPEDITGQIAITSLVSQSQLTLLKLLDSYLHYGAVSYFSKISEGKEPTQGLDELMTTFVRLAIWAEGAMKDAIEGDSKGHVDLRLVEVHIGLVLLLQCLITLGMKTENNEGKNEKIPVVAREMLNQMRSSSFVQVLISLLHTLAIFAPPISPFRPTTTSPRQDPVQAPPGHAVTSTGAAVATDVNENGPGLDNLKREIVNLLGVLSYKRASDDKEAVLLVQDTVREGGGLFDVMNMTQLDEHNPYIRERAIFTLRNLLLGNQASQDLVAKLKPMPR